MKTTESDAASLAVTIGSKDSIAEFDKAIVFHSYFLENLHNFPKR